MALKCQMTWDSARGRWRKVHRGKVYYFSPGGTKEATYQAANAWWRDKRAELDASRPAHPHAGRIAELERRLRWAGRHGTPAEPIQNELDHTRTLSERDDDPPPLDYPDEDRLRLLARYGIIVTPAADPEVVARVIGVRRVHDDRARRDESEPTPPDRTIGALAERYSALERVRYASGDIKIATWVQERGCLFVFRDWAGADQDASVINADKYETYWEHISKNIKSIDSKKRHLRIAKQFLIWLSEKGIIPLPSNLASRRYRFKGEPVPIAVMTVAQVQTLIANATGQLKLHLLLMLNCGFTQIDIAELRQCEVDWSAGRITRRRSKATSGGYSKAPTVTWQLWNATFSLLKEHRQAGDDRVLLTEDGTAWVRRSPKGDDGFTKTDSIMSSYRRLLDRLAMSHPGKTFGSPSELRATASTMLDNHPSYGRYAQHFLGQTPRSVAASNYVVPSQTQFDKAVAWLGTQFGF